ncbi:LysE family translocator [Methanoplanus sp. FWC-SCC4]|uniref:LysE family translocator n=1 Tax=Methanochimaera problematica TaxID=2609417 RepID=A0AA97FDT3_9EURY|nr:LysE family transporter [Methanoplanus sp. FWC-SCC4]WOF17212.1 LysE family translocator [Methanoplanus sp. FWC-SCC4]
MESLTGFFALSFIIGLTGAIAPGPTLIATIKSSLDTGWVAGPKISAGHMLIEAFFGLVIIYGFSIFLLEYTNIIGFAGGVALIVFGILNIKCGISPVLPGEEAVSVTNPYLAGIITSASNPYFWIWWLTVGSGFLLDGLKAGTIFAAAFITGHWMSDLCWFSAVSTCTSRGKNMMNTKIYGYIIILCGVFLVMFGLYYIISSYGI